MTIRFRLGLALALALLPVLILGSFETWQSFNRDAIFRQQSLTLAAARSAIGARAQVQNAAALLDALAPQTTGLQCSERLAAAMRQARGYDNLIRLDAVGRIQCAADTVGADPGRRTSAWFRELAEGEALAIAEAPPGVYARRPAILAASPIESPTGQFAGALVAVIGLDALRPDLSDPGLPRGVEVELLNRNEHPVVRTAPAAFAPPPASWRSAATSRSGVLYTARAPSGQERLHAIAPLIEDRLYVVLSAPAPRLLSFARLNPLATIGLPLLAWLLAWGAVSLVTERLVIRWLAYLERIAAIYARGRFTVRPVQAENAPLEIRTLAHTLDAMADGLVARDQSLRDSLAQKDTLMREIHHRVKNNLQVITSLLNMQQRSLTDPAARSAMADTRQRISALALIYRALYQSPDLRRVDVRQFLEELTGQLAVGDSGESRVRMVLEADDLEIDPDKLAPLALYAVEAITNARKHAYDEAGGVVHVQFRIAESEVWLEVADDGRGASEPGAMQGVGATLMTAFARQLRGVSKVTTEPGGGVRVRLTFPKPEPLGEIRLPGGNSLAA